MKVSVQLNPLRCDSNRQVCGFLHDIQLNTALTLSAALRVRAIPEVEAVIVVDGDSFGTSMKPWRARHTSAWVAWCQRRRQLPAPPPA